MKDCKPRTTPCEVQFDDNAHNNEPCINPTKYRELVGSLIYAATSRRPDISFVVSKLSQHLSTPLNKHMLMGKHVLRYLKGTLNYELVYRRSDEPLEQIAYCDSDWASSKEDRKSITGYCFSMTKSGGIISWKSRKQPTVALSTCEAEYMGLGSVTQKSFYLTQLLRDMDEASIFKIQDIPLWRLVCLLLISTGGLNIMRVSGGVRIYALMIPSYICIRPIRVLIFELCNVMDIDVIK